MPLLKWGKRRRRKTHKYERKAERRGEKRSTPATGHKRPRRPTKTARKKPLPVAVVRKINGPKHPCTVWCRIAIYCQYVNKYDAAPPHLWGDRDNDGNGVITGIIRDLPHATAGGYQRVQAVLMSIYACVRDRVQWEPFGKRRGGHNAKIPLGSVEAELVASAMEKGLGLTAAMEAVNRYRVGPVQMFFLSFVSSGRVVARVSFVALSFSLALFHSLSLSLSLSRSELGVPSRQIQNGKGHVGRSACYTIHRKMNPVVTAILRCSQGEKNDESKPWAKARNRWTTQLAFRFRVLPLERVEAHTAPSAAGIKSSTTTATARPWTSRCSGRCSCRRRPPPSSRRSPSPSRRPHCRAAGCRCRAAGRRRAHIVIRRSTAPPPRPPPRDALAAKGGGCRLPCGTKSGRGQ